MADDDLLAGLLETFGGELEDYHTLATRCLIELERPESSPELVNEAFRAVHSIKGAAAVIGLEGMTRVAHAVETLLGDVRHGRRQPTAGAEPRPSRRNALHPPGRRRNRARPGEPGRPPAVPPGGSDARQSSPDLPRRGCRAPERDGAHALQEVVPLAFVRRCGAVYELCRQRSAGRPSLEQANRNLVHASSNSAESSSPQSPVLNTSSSICWRTRLGAGLDLSVARRALVEALREQRFDPEGGDVLDPPDPGQQGDMSKPYLMSQRTTLVLDDESRAAAKELALALQVPMSEAIRRAIIRYRDHLRGVSPEARRRRVDALHQLISLFEGYDPTEELRTLREEDL
ncbi:MAG: Hpt domain-containing protein [Armatimonadetes bacterium]|nr:Hpt domain-containing protein [Armatimonadota bacterium]